MVAGLLPPTAQSELGDALQSAVAHPVPSALQPVRAKTPPDRLTGEVIVPNLVVTEAGFKQNWAVPPLGGRSQGLLAGPEEKFGSGSEK